MLCCRFVGLTSCGVLPCAHRTQMSASMLSSASTTTTSTVRSPVLDFLGGFAYDLIHSVCLQHVKFVVYFS